MKNAESLRKGSGIRYGIIACAICVISRILFENPLEMLHIVNGRHLLPPMWLYNVISYILFFLIGFSAGSIADMTSSKINCGRAEVLAYKGGIYFCFCFFSSIIHYHCFFLGQRLFLALLISVVCTICAVVCAVSWRNARPSTSSLIMFFFALWQLYICFVSLSVFLRH